MRNDIRGWSIVLILIGSLTFVTWKTAIFYAVLVFSLAYIIAIYVSRRFPSLTKNTTILLLIFLCAGLILHGNYPGPKKWQFGVNGDEAASRYMSESLPKEAVVLAGSPAAVWMARLNYAGLNATDIPIFADDVEFGTWVRQNFDAIYIDHTISPYYLDLIEKRIGKDFMRVFVAEDGDYQVLQVIKLGN